MDVGTIILLVVVVLHFLIGFGYLVYKLSPKEKLINSENEEKSSSEHDSKK